jgi:hypothetical protein
MQLVQQNQALFCLQMLDTGRPVPTFSGEQECFVFAESRKEQAMATLVNLDIWKHMSGAGGPRALTMSESAKSVDGVTCPYHV